MNFFFISVHTFKLLFHDLFRVFICLNWVDIVQTTKFYCIFFDIT